MTTYGNSYSLNTSNKVTLSDAEDKVTPTSQTIIDNDNNANQSGTAYVGNSNTMKFHKPSCSSVPTISPDHLVYFSNRSDATNAGYKPCKRCNP